MRMKFDMADQFEVALGEAGDKAVDVAKLAEHPAVLAYVFGYGLKQMLNDVHAGETKAKTADDDQRKANKIALVEKKLASLYAGEVAQARIGTGDPVKREMRAMAEQEIKDGLRRLGKKLSTIDKKVLASLVDKQVAAHDERLRKAAEAKLAIKPEAVEDPDDILAMLAEVEGSAEEPEGEEE